MAFTLRELKLIQKTMLDKFYVLNDLIDNFSMLLEHRKTRDYSEETIEDIKNTIDKLVDKQNKVYDVIDKVGSLIRKQIDNEIERLEETEDE